MARKTIDQKRVIVTEAYSKPRNIKATARKYSIQPQHIRRWRGQILRFDANTGPNRPFRYHTLCPASFQSPAGSDSQACSASASPSPTLDVAPHEDSASDSSVSEADPTRLPDYHGWPVVSQAGLAAFNAPLVDTGLSTTPSSDYSFGPAACPQLQFSNRASTDQTPNIFFPASAYTDNSYTDNSFASTASFPAIPSFLPVTSFQPPSFQASPFPATPSFPASSPFSTNTAAPACSPFASTPSRPSMSPYQASSPLPETPLLPSVPQTLVGTMPILSTTLGPQPSVVLAACPPFQPDGPTLAVTTTGHNFPNLFVESISAPTTATIMFRGLEDAAALYQSNVTYRLAQPDDAFSPLPPDSRSMLPYSYSQAYSPVGLATEPRLSISSPEIVSPTSAAAYDTPATSRPW
ncbi:uncharacterized protein BJ171DRAFT_597711 [Polychytrium aggregatum]|uniref:uncharacterized protein n=1 Tax=Polychytrium aggregatum TaxID=110093 RepID=UPI0022FDCA7B|nr:uncharacterized protein BJ171DRAFT_597711 [Polychytrium aggregatum]KAI9206027.1 hypothetical protein BJ171DRAFT_597711 [Polychytrium aggregatum]